MGQDAARGVFGRSLVLGDSGCPLRTYLMMPVPNPITLSEEDFNKAHIHTRGLIECAIGHWKHRCIHRSAGGLKFTPATCCAVIVVTAMLHNIAVRARAHLPMEEDEVEDEADDDNPPPPEDRAALHNAGFQARQNIINLFACVFFSPLFLSMHLSQTPTKLPTIFLISPHNKPTHIIHCGTHQVKMLCLQLPTVSV